MHPLSFLVFANIVDQRPSCERNVADDIRYALIPLSSPVSACGIRAFEASQPVRTVPQHLCVAILFKVSDGARIQVIDEHRWGF